MKFETYLEAQLRQRLKKSRVLVVHDAERRYAGVVPGLADETTTVLDCGGDLLEARERAFEELNRIGADQSGKAGLLIYVPRQRSLDPLDQLADPFAPFALAGATFPDGAGDSYRALCLQYLPEQAGRIDQIFADKEEPGFGIINGLAGGGTASAVLVDALGGESSKELLLRFLCMDEPRRKKLRATAIWLKDFKALVEKTLGLKLEGQKEAVAEIQGTLWTYLLFSEFAADLPGELPASLSAVPRAGQTHEPFVRSVCHALRDTGEYQGEYEDSAERVAAALHMEEACAGINDFGELDTFSFEERSFLRRFATHVEARQYEDAQHVLNRRKDSFWAARDPERTAEWRLGEFALRLLVELSGIAEPLAQKRKLEEWLDFQEAIFSRVDALHRAVEQVAAEIAPVEGPLQAVLARAREQYSAFADKLARHFQDSVAAEGWPAQGRDRAVDTFERFVEPAWKSGQRVAYFWIDALRFDLATPLEAALATRHGTRLHTVCGQLPGITPVGMAALLPGAGAGLELIEEGGKVIPVITGRRIENAKARADTLAAYVGSDRCRVVDLEDAAAGKLGANPDAIQVLAVKSTDIDLLGENNPAYFLRIVPEILRKIQAAVNRLADLGFQRAVLATDHGFCWLPTGSAGNAITMPTGIWPLKKDRCLLGAGAGDKSSLFAEPRALGIRTALTTFAAPRGLATYTAGVAYFHGGISLQENLLPVLEVELKPALKPKAAERAQLTLTYRGAGSGKITSLVASLELSYPAADLFGPASVQLVLQGINVDGQIVATPSASALVDPTTGEVCLERGKAVKIPIRVREGFQGEFTVEAKDATTGWRYAAVKLVTEFHHS
jgi:hypothetical protein